MPTLDVTFTLALPVSVTQLVAHMEAYRETLPALNALRACNRFGKESQCHINKLPVELVQRVAHYYILPEREKKLKDWKKRLLCYEDDCEMIDHFSEEWLLDTYIEWRGARGLSPLSDCECGQCIPDFPCDPPTDEQLEEMLIAIEAFPTEEHEDRKEAWVPAMRVAVSQDRPVMQTHFGLDIWLSRVCLGTSWREDSANTTVAYLILRDRAEHTKIWERHLSDDGYSESSYESGYGMTVAMDQHGTLQDIQKFKRVMRVLGLEVHIHDSQSQDKPLSLAPITEDKQTDAAADTTASFPRPTLLVRNKVEGE
jgi:hypothetical protein